MLQQNIVLCGLNYRLLFHTVLEAKSKIRLSTDSVLSKDSFLSFQTTAFSLCAHITFPWLISWKEKVLMSLLFIGALISSWDHSHDLNSPNYYPKAFSLNTATLGIRAYTQDLGAGHIHSIHSIKLVSDNCRCWPKKEIQSLKYLRLFLKSKTKTKTAL